MPGQKNRLNSIKVNAKASCTIKANNFAIVKKDALFFHKAPASPTNNNNGLVLHALLSAFRRCVDARLS